MKTILLSLAAGLVLLGCTNPSPSASDIRAQINDVLSVGDPRERIEPELKKLGIQTDYDKFRNRYQAGVETTNESSSIAIWIYLDEERRTIERIVVEDAYTFL